jgi:hypothetical protein
MAIVTQERAKELLEYTPENGLLVWKKTNSNAAKKGTIAGYLSKTDNRVSVRIDSKLYKAHRVIFLIVTGEWPEEIDHINGDSSDNRWDNLRSVTHRENMKNRKVCSNSKTGIMGVVWNRHNSKWRVRVKAFDVHLEIGSFFNFFDACCARISAENKMGFHANHGRVAP